MLKDLKTQPWPVLFSWLERCPINQTSKRTSEEGNSDVTDMLELPAQSSKAPVAGVRSALVKMVGNTQEQTGNISRHGNQGKIQMGSAGNKKQNRNE